MSALPVYDYIDPLVYWHLSEPMYLAFLYHLCTQCLLLEHFMRNHRWTHVKPDLMDGYLSDVLVKMHVCKKRPTQHIIAYIYQALCYCCSDINQKAIEHPIIQWDFSQIQAPETMGHENILDYWEGFFIRDHSHNFVMVDELKKIWDHFRDQELLILQLRFIEGWSYYRISDLLSIPKTTLYHLIETLQNRLIHYMIQIRK